LRNGDRSKGALSLAAYLEIHKNEISEPEPWLRGLNDSHFDAVVELPRGSLVELGVSAPLVAKWPQ
jgi:hypothetical protein